MNKLKFKYLHAKNFLCYGEEGISLDLNKYKNIILVNGSNYDIFEENDKVASNGSGKSTIPEIIIYTLFGKTIKEKLKHGDIINNQIGKNLVTEVIFDNIKISRGRKPNFLRIWESDKEDWSDENEITLGGMPATQELIENKIGFSYETFVNTMIFTDSNKDSFLECDVPTKRKIVENILSLQEYQNYLNGSKDLRNSLKDKIKMLYKDYENNIEQKKYIEENIEKNSNEEINWKKNKENEIRNIINIIKSKKELMSTTDEGKQLKLYEESVEKISLLKEENSKFENDKNDLEEKLSSYKEDILNKNEQLSSFKINLNKLNNDKNILVSDIDELNEKMSDINNKDGTTCPTCLGKVNKDNFKDVLKNSLTIIENKNNVLTKINKDIDVSKESYDKLYDNMVKIKELILEYKSKIDLISNKISENNVKINKLSLVEKPNKTLSQEKIEHEIELLKSKALEKKEELDSKSPYRDIILREKESLKKKNFDCEKIKEKIKENEEELPYYDFWVEAFGDNGIRKFIIDGVIPSLNSKINYWLQFLINNKISIKFNNQLEESITKFPNKDDSINYYALSGGERRRVNLAISQSFSHIMSLNSGTLPSIVFLDEISTNIDQVGIQGLYNMILELSKERQVFVTTHDRDLLEMLASCDSINLIKRNGITVLESE